MSIGAIQLVGSLPSTNDALVTDLSAFGFSFFILINIWNRYTTTTSVMPVETAVLVRLNMVLLFLVAIEPFLFNLMVIRGLGPNSVIGPEVSEFYALDLAGMNFILAYFTHVLSLEEKNLIPRELIHRFRVSRNGLFLVGMIFLISDLPTFWDVLVGGLPLRIVIWVVTLPMLWLPRLLANRL